MKLRESALVCRPVLDDGTVLQCVNLGWGKFNVSEKMSEMFHGIEVKAGNDANVAALGEAWKGGGKILMISLWLHLEQV